MKSHLQPFMQYLTEDKGLSPSTLESYGRDVTQFLEFAAGRGIASPDEIRRSHLLQYHAQLRGQDGRRLPLTGVRCRCVLFSLFAENLAD